MSKLFRWSRWTKWLVVSGQWVGLQGPRGSKDRPTGSQRVKG